MAITAETRTEIIALVVGTVGAAPGATVLDELALVVDGGVSLADLSIAIANNPAFKLIYPSFLSNEEFAANWVGQLLGSTVSAENMALAVDGVAALLNSGQSRGQVMWDVIQIVANIDTADENFGAAAAALNNKVDVAEYYSVELLLSAPTLTELQAVIENVDDTAASVTAAMAIADGTSSEGTTFTLTTNIDEFTGTKNDDIFNATDKTYTGFDVLVGGGGNDTLNVTNVGGTPPALTLGTVSQIENVVYQSSLGAVTAAVDAFSGVHNVTVLNIDPGNTATTVTTKGNATMVTTSGGGVVAITDNATTDTLTTVSATGAVTSLAVTSSALTNLNITNSAVGATVTAAAGTRNLDVGLNAATGGTVTDATATSVGVNATGATSTGVTLTAGAATALTLSGSAKLTLADVNIGAVKTITATGSAAATISATTAVGALTAVDASGSTGGLTITPALAVGVLFTGGDGKDSVSLGATTKAITTGAGDDTVVFGATAVGTGGTIDAGEGSDTLSMTAANAATASGTTTLEGKISGFEKLTLTAPTTDTVNLANLDDINYVTTAGATALTLGGMLSGGTLVLTAANTAATINMVAAATLATDDVINLMVTNAAGVAAGTITVANVETVNLTTDDSAATPTGIAHSATLTAANATALNVSGDAGATLTLTGSTALAAIDTSGVTKGAVSLTTVADVATTFVGGATATTVSLAGITTATKAGTITTGAGNDTITGGAGADTINAGSGTNTINGGGGADVITGGDKVDTITGGTGADTLTGGDGADIFNYTAAAESNGVNQDTITDFVTKTDKIQTATAATYLGEANGYGAVLTSLTSSAWDAVLDTSTSTLYIDVDGDGALTAADLTIQLTGITDLNAADFI